jgi:hypothetical protein
VVIDGVVIVGLVLVLVVRLIVIVIVVLAVVVVVVVVAAVSISHAAAPTVDVFLGVRHIREAPLSPALGFRGGGGDPQGGQGWRGVSTTTATPTATAGSLPPSEQHCTDGP